MTISFNPEDFPESKLRSAMHAVENHLANREAEQPKLVGAYRYFVEQLSYIESGGFIQGVIDSSKDRQLLIDGYYRFEETPTPESQEIVHRLYEFVVSQEGFEGIKVEDLESLRQEVLDLLSD